ncbi:ATP-binding protein [Saccharothrix deserti]|uniref:ATP-binding protein n=1 Tax=Saccharothrix deserti TaxID=2593674 RepID=UPI00131AA84E|nr:ATP-binding protein [Saccharothrix deserti]
MVEWSARRLFPGDDPTSDAHRAHDWSATPLGPVASWSVELRAAIRTVMPSRVPMLLWWGPRLVQIFNHAYTPVLGDKYPRAIGQPGAECWAEVWDELGPLARQALDEGVPTYSENQLLFLHRHGYREETYWTFSYSPVHAEDGTVAGIFVATTDVTARVLGERRLETLRQLGTLSIAEADTAADACRAAVKVLAGSSADLPRVAAYLRTGGGEPTLVASTGTGAGIPADVVGRVAGTGQAEMIGRDETLVVPLTAGARGTHGALVVGLSPFRRFDQSYASFVDLVTAGVATAVDDTVAYEAERTRAEALAELDAAKTRFFQNIGHEFRTPLTLLLAPLSTLLEDHAAALPAGQREAVSAAHRAALRLRRLVDTLLDVSRAEADHLHIRLEPTDVAALTADCAAMFRATAEELGLELVVETSGGTVWLDQEMWARIVLNLLSNAIKYTTEGTIAVTVWTTGDSCVLTVADTGVGIPEAEQGRVFQRFHQVDGVTGRSREGAGIGLSLVADLAAALGGTVAVRSTPGRGSTFTVTVPRADAADAVRRVPLDDLGASFIGETRQWTPPAAAEPVAGTGERRILLVEDNADMRDYLARLLTAQHWRVDAVGDTETALKHARTSRPDLVLSDVMLPGRDGVALLGDLRSDPVLARVPVVLLTARAGTESAVEGLRNGADDYVVKPFHPAELIARTRVHLELSSFREALLAEGEREASTLREALASRTTTSQAVGILMALHRCDADTAFRKITAWSQHRNVKVRDIAAELVARFVDGLSGS